MAKEYIEREALLDALYETEFQTFVPLDEVSGVVDAIPAADVIEVRHGRWIHNEKTFSNGLSYHRWTCSLCGRAVARKDKADIEDLPYCNCGAKMDGGRE